MGENLQKEQPKPKAAGTQQTRAEKYSVDWEITRFKDKTQIQATGLKQAGDEEMGRAPVGFLPRNYRGLKVTIEGKTEPRRECFSFSFLYFYERLDPDLFTE